MTLPCSSHVLTISDLFVFGQSNKTKQIQAHGSGASRTMGRTSGLSPSVADCACPLVVVQLAFPNPVQVDIPCTEEDRVSVLFIANPQAVADRCHTAR